MYVYEHGTVRVTLEYSHYHLGREYLKYVLYDDNDIIFQGNELNTPLAHNDMDSVMALLSFLTLQPGDTDGEYFKAYTPKQLEWIESDNAQELRYIIYDYENNKQ